MKTISIDFDGVIHSYNTKWTNAGTISDPPVPGAIPFLKDLVTSGEWDVCIFSTRNNEASGIIAMKEWLINWCDARDDRLWINHVRFPTEKPLAFIGIDDRILTFTGKFPSLKELSEFKPWNKK